MGWSSSTCPSARLRARIRGGAAAKKAAAWRSLASFGGPGRGQAGCLEERADLTAHVPTVSHTVASTSLPDIDPKDSGWDFPSQEALAHTLRKAATRGDWAVQVTRVMVFIKSHTQQAVNAAAVDSARCWKQWAKEACQGSARRSAWFLQGWPRCRRWRGVGWAAALGQSNGDVAAALAGSAQSQRQAAGRPGGYGRALAKTFTQRGRQCGQDIQAQRRTGSRLHHPKAILQLPVELRVRFIDLLVAFEAKLLALT